MFQRIIITLLLSTIIVGCTGTSSKTFAQKYGTPLRLVVTPANVWLDAPGSQVYVETYVVTDRNNRVYVSTKNQFDTPWITEINPIDTGKFQLKALSDGETTMDLSYAIGLKEFKTQLTAKVMPDLITVGGFDRAPIYEMRSSKGEFALTNIDVGGNEGVAEFFVFGDKIYTVSNDSGIGDTIEILDKNSLVTLKKFVFTPRRFIQKMILLSPDKAILIPQLSDAYNNENILIVDLQTGAVLDKINILNNTGFGLWMADAVIRNDRLYISTTPFDNNAWAFRQCYVIVIDLTNKTVVDTDLSDSDIDFITLSFENPRRMFLEDDGDLLVFCAGNDLSTPKTESAVLIYDTNSFKLKDTFKIGTNGYLGITPIIDKTGRIYLADQYQPNVFSFDTITDKLLRDKTNVMYFPPPQAIGFADGVISGNKLYLTNPYGYLVQSVNISNDDNVLMPSYQFYLKMNVSFTHIESRRDKNLPCFVQEIVNSVDLIDGSNKNLAFDSPEGAGIFASSSDIVEIGDNAIIFGFGDRKCINAPGTDFVIFTASKYRNSGKPQDLDISSWRDMTPAKVSVSADGENWIVFPASENNTYSIHDPRRFEGSWAGINPTIANSTNQMFLDYASSGGDRFDLAILDIQEIRYIKIEGKGCKVDAIALLNNLED